MSNGPVVVIGGGPAGLAAALMLAKRGWKDIIILEELSKEQYFQYDRSYASGVDTRGQQLFHLLDIYEKLQEYGVYIADSPGFFISSPTRGLMSFPTSKQKSVDNDIYWIYRSDVCEIFLNEVAQYNDTIKFHFDACYTDFQVTPNGLLLSYAIQGKEQPQISPQLLLGCDGLNSGIRKKLQEVANNERFYVNTISVPLSGQGYKVLKLPEGFKIGEKKIEPDAWYRIYGISKDSEHVMNISTMPSSKTLRQQQYRLGLIRLTPDHHMWDLEDAQDVLTFLCKEFPQLQIRDIVDLQEADRFAKSKGGKYPLSGYCEHMQYVSHDSEGQMHGVVLLGDAIHFSPPTLAQGLNAALEDVVVLDKALGRNENRLELALEEYERLRAVDGKALAEITNVPLTARYQWLFRLLLLVPRIKGYLNQISPSLFPPGLSIYLRDYKLRYSEVQRLHNRANIVYYCYLFVLFFGMYILFKGLLWITF